MRTYERIGFTLGVIVVFVALIVGMSRLAHSGADIPVHYGGYFYPPAVHQPCLLTYYATRSFGCDRIAVRSFEP